MIRTAMMLAGLALAACASRVPFGATPRAPSYWSLPGPRDRARRWGSMVGVQQVGRCERWEAPAVATTGGGR